MTVAKRASRAPAPTVTAAAPEPVAEVAEGEPLLVPLGDLLPPVLVAVELGEPADVVPFDTMTPVVEAALVVAGDEELPA